MSISIGQFGGIAPKINPPLLETNMATVAQNLRVDRGSIRPLNGLTQVVASPSGTLGYVPSTIYKYSSPPWLYWDAPNVDVAMSPVPADAYGRIYYTDPTAAYPQYTFTGRPSVNGTPNGLRLGIPQPANGKIASAAVSGTGTGTAYERFYTFSYVSPLGEEGPPMATPLPVTSVQNGQTVTLNFNTETLTNYNLATGLRRIYRTAQGTNSTTFEFVADVVIGTTTYADSILDSALGEIMPSANWFAPPAAMIGLKSTGSGFFVGYYGNTLYVSELFMPHAWNPNNELAFPFPITALAVTTDSIVVFTQGNPYLVTGTDPATLTAIKIDNAQSVPFRKSCVDMGGYVMAASPDGLIAIQQAQIQMATLDYYTLQQWQAAFPPATLYGFYYEGIYVGFSGSNGFMFDMRKSPAVLTTLSGFPTIVGSYNDLSTDTLYLLDSTGIIWSWETGNPMMFTWKSKPVRVPMPMCPACGRIYASGTVTFQLWADGNPVYSVAVSDSNVFRLPSGYRGREFYVQLSGTNAVDSLSIANSVAELT